MDSVELYYGNGNSWERYSLEKGQAVTLGEATPVTVLFVCSGTVMLSTGRREGLMVEAGKIILCPRQRTVMVEAIETAIIFRCTFFLDLLLEVLSEEKLDLDDYPANRDKVSSLDINRTLGQFLRLTGDYIIRGLNGNFLSELKARELLAILLGTYSREQAREFFAPFAGEELRFRKMVLINCLKVRNVKHLAEIANYSTSGFIKRFHKFFNEPPHQWIARKKALGIQHDILAGKNSLQQIAHKYMFSSYRRFVDFCQTQFGLPPSKITSKKNRNIVLKSQNRQSNR